MSDSKPADEVEQETVDDSKLKLPEVHLEKVDIKVDEGEDCIYTQRCRVFLFFEEEEYGGEVRKNFWKERGTGDCKFLQNQETKKIRIVMRQEKTGKVCLNFIIDPRCYLSPNVGSDRSWVFNAQDYSDGELKAGQYAIRFKDNKIAQEFRKQYNDARESNSKLLNIPVAEEPIPQVATAPESDAPDLSKLNISDKKPEDDKA